GSSRRQMAPEAVPGRAQPVEASSLLSVRRSLDRAAVRLATVDSPAAGVVASGERARAVAAHVALNGARVDELPLAGRAPRDRGPEGGVLFGVLAATAASGFGSLARGERRVQLGQR